MENIYEKIIFNPSFKLLNEFFYLFFDKKEIKNKLNVVKRVKI